MTLTDLRRQIIKMPMRAGSGHIPSALSILEIVWTLYNRVMTANDRFILSKGHGALALYAVLADKGILPAEELDRFGVFGGLLGGHPDSMLVPGVEASTGSLGHGLAFGCGIALAKKLKQESGRVFVLVGDGECMEGSVWEAVDLAARMSLNVVIIVDQNGTHKLARDFHAAVTVDGHHVDDLAIALDRGGPNVIVAITTKGHGCKTMEAEPNAWHNRAPKEGEIGALLAEVG